LIKRKKARVAMVVRWRVLNFCSTKSFRILVNILVYGIIVLCFAFAGGNEEGGDKHEHRVAARAATATAAAIGASPVEATEAESGLAAMQAHYQSI
jgi:hypothetical protein